MRETIRKWIEECIREETARTGAPNRWGHPLVGFADASDEAFLPLRQAAHPNHRLASEELPGATVAVSWFLPFTRALAEGNRAGELPSRDWSDAYGETNAMARRVNEYLVRRLGEMGARAAVPQGADCTDPERVMSLWSQRHVAWLAGLGTFGRNNLLIGERTAEEMKINIGSAYPRREPIFMEVKGRNLISGLPQSLTVGSNEMIEALEEPLQTILESVRGIFEKTPPELTSDIADNGICLTGGGALLYGMDKFISEHTKVPCYIAEDAVSCVAIGTGKALENIDLYSRGAVYDYKRGDYFETTSV